MYSQLRVLMNFYRNEGNWGAILKFPFSYESWISAKFKVYFSRMNQENSGKVQLGGEEASSIYVTATNASALNSALHTVWDKESP